MSDIRKIMESLDQINEDSSEREEFEDIITQIEELTNAALQMTPSNEQQRARSYWYGHIMTAIGSEMYGRSMYSMRDTLASFENEGLEKAAQELDAYMDENPDADLQKVAALIASKHGVDVDELDEYMNE